jgi:hypothetical protein
MDEVPTLGHGGEALVVLEHRESYGEARADVGVAIEQCSNTVHYYCALFMKQFL